MKDIEGIMMGAMMLLGVALLTLMIEVFYHWTPQGGLPMKKTPIVGFN